MKSYFPLLSFAAGIFLLSLSACSDQFEIAAPYKPITVAYGLLNQKDTAHYIRIQKAFLDDQQSAVVMSKVADSNYWPNLQVLVREMNGTNVINNLPLTRVDMAQEGYIKLPGDSLNFFTTPNYAYKLKHNLNPNLTYRLVIINNDTKEVDSAETVIIDSNFTAFELQSTTYQLDFSKPGTSVTANLQGIAPAGANFFQALIRFRYVDKDLATGIQTDQILDYRLPNTVVVAPNTSATFEIRTPHAQILSYLTSNIPASNGNIARYLDSADVFLYAGGQELYTYITVANNQNTGLTSDQIQPKYTNLKGANVLGLFSTRTFRAKYNVRISLNTLSELMTNPQTVPLNFKGYSDH